MIKAIKPEKETVELVKKIMLENPGKTVDELLETFGKICPDELQKKSI